MCVMNCPIGVIQIDKKNNRIVSKCDRCVERGMPACVEHCPNEAILLVDEGVYRKKSLAEPQSRKEVGLD